MQQLRVIADGKYYFNLSQSYIFNLCDYFTYPCTRIFLDLLQYLVQCFSHLELADVRVLVDGGLLCQERGKSGDEIPFGRYELLRVQTERISSLHVNGTKQQVNNVNTRIEVWKN